MPWAYLLRCADGTLYGGAAKDLAARLAQHEAGTASRYTRSRLPVTLAWACPVATWSDALREEHRVKGLPRAAKETLVAEGAASLTHLTPSSYREMPWKNGRGVTTEIARHPAGDGPFDWRVSAAVVTEDGPFSPFPGTDRVIVALDAAGLSLVHDGSNAVVLPPLTPHVFSGDATTTGGPVDGPVRDFNVIWRRDTWAAEVAVVRSLSTLAVAGTTLVYAVDGRATVVLPGIDLHLGVGETLRIQRTTPSGAVLRPDTGAALIHVTLTPLGSPA